MINLSLDDLKLVAKNGNTRDYENKSKKDLIKVLSKTKSKIRINKKVLEEIRRDFKELRHKFSKKEIDKYKKRFLRYRKQQISFSIRNKEGRKKF